MDSQALAQTRYQARDLFQEHGDAGPGTRLGRFTLLEELGKGGMGSVWAAYDPDLDRRVAIKILHAPAGDGEADHARLWREAQAMARIRDPNVVTVYEVGGSARELFLVMEYVRGTTLRERAAELRDSGGSWRDILSLFVLAGRGLASAHKRGMVHRDFKPANVLVDADERVLVCDFGLAVRGGANTPTANSATERWIDSSITEPGAIIGTPLYMSPEQHRGDEVGAKSDQFSFCAALFHSLSGERPFAGRSAGELHDSKMTGGKDLPSSPRVPAWLRTVLLRGMSPDPADRYSSMTELLEELGADRETVRFFRTEAWAMTLMTALWVSLPVATFLYIKTVGKITFPGLLAIDLTAMAMTFLLYATIASRRHMRLLLANKLVCIALLGDLLITSGAEQLGMSVQDAAVLHILIWFLTGFTVMVLVDRRLWPGVAGALTAYLAACADPINTALYMALCLAGLGLSAVIAWRSR